jgi:hypothetical protein
MHMYMHAIDLDLVQGAPDPDRTRFQERSGSVAPPRAEGPIPWPRENEEPSYSDEADFRHG